MIYLLKAELIKLVNKKGFWIILALYGIIAYIGINIITGIKLNDVEVKNFINYGFPDIWKILTFVLSYGSIIISILIVMITSEEFQHKTMRQSIIDGLDIKDIVISKEMIIFLLSLTLTLIFTLIGYIVGSENTSDTSISAFDGYQHMFYFFLNLLGVLNFAFLVTIIVKQTAFSVLTIIFYYLIESFLGVRFPEIFSFFPMNSFSDLILTPQIFSMETSQAAVSATNILMSILWIVVFIFSSFIILKKRDN